MQNRTPTHTSINVWQDGRTTGNEHPVRSSLRPLSNPSRPALPAMFARRPRSDSARNGACSELNGVTSHRRSHR
jgi:hypothetical protein